MLRVCDELEEKWLKIRDMLLGCNFADQDIRGAVELARKAQDHPDASWLLNKLSAHMSTLHNVEKVSSILLDDVDPRGLTFGSILKCYWEPDLSKLRRAASQGYAFACAWLSLETTGQESWEFAQKAGACSAGFCFMSNRRI